MIRTNAIGLAFPPERLEELNRLLEAANGGGFEIAVLSDGSSGLGLPGGEVMGGLGTDFPPAALSGAQVIGHLHIDGGRFAVPGADGSPEVAGDLFGENALEVVGGLDDFLGSMADEFEGGRRPRSRGECRPRRWKRVSDRPGA